MTDPAAVTGPDNQGWLDPARVAEIIVDRGVGVPGGRGSGYLLRTNTVLTAAHVVADAVSVTVRFNANSENEWIAPALTWAVDNADIAVLTVASVDGQEVVVTPVVLGRLIRKDCVVGCRAVGFPLFKLRSRQPLRQYINIGSPDAKKIKRYRDSRHAVGSIALLSNRRQDTFEVSVPPPENTVDPDVSTLGGHVGRGAVGRRMHRSGDHRTLSGRRTGNVDGCADRECRPHGRRGGADHGRRIAAPSG